MDVVELTRRLVATPSVNPNSVSDPARGHGEAAMAAAVREVLITLGATQLDWWDTYPGRPSVSGYLDFGAKETLVFDTHLDTVPVDGMSIDPFAGEVREGRLYGRGACDMKGPMAAMLCALELASESAAPLRYNVLFAATADEEAGFGGVKSLLARLQNCSYAPIAGAIVAEPTRLNPVVAHKGTCRWVVSTAGVAAHSSTPHLGQNAIYAMAPIITALQRYADELATRPAHPNLGTPTLSVGVIHGGVAVNVVPDACSIQVDRRLVPAETLEVATEELRAVLKDFAVTISEPMVAAPAMETGAESPLAALALKAATAAGHSPAMEYANYCTNASFYPGSGINPIVFGPGNIAQAHTKDEWIALHELHAGVQAYYNLLAS